MDQLDAGAATPGCQLMLPFLSRLLALHPPLYLLSEGRSHPVLCWGLIISALHPRDSTLLPADWAPPVSPSLSLSSSLQRRGQSVSLDCRSPWTSSPGWSRGYWREGGMLAAVESACGSESFRAPCVAGLHTSSLSGTPQPAVPSQAGGPGTAARAVLARFTRAGQRVGNAL